MVVSILKRSFAAAAVCVAGIVSIAAAPAMANTSAATAEIPAEVRDADNAPVSGGDAGPGAKERRGHVPLFC